MKEIPDLQKELQEANEKNVFGTKNEISNL